MNYNVIVIEDEETAYRNLKRLLEEKHKKYFISGWLRSVQESIIYLQENPKPDLIFLDVQLGDGLSFSIFKEVKIDCPIIFTTAYEEHALKAFQLDSIDYLLKPFSPAQLKKALQKFEKRSDFAGISPSVIAKIVEGFQEKKVNYKERFHIKKGRKLLVIKIEEVAWFGLDNYVFLMTNSGQKFILDYSLDQLQKILDPKSFFRLNRKFIAKIDAIQTIETNFDYKLKINLSPPFKEAVYVSKDKAKTFKNWLG